MSALASTSLAICKFRDAAQSASYRKVCSGFPYAGARVGEFPTIVSADAAEISSPSPTYRAIRQS
jgi:hypothetical protein